MFVQIYNELRAFNRESKQYKSIMAGMTERFDRLDAARQKVEGGMASAICILTYDKEETKIFVDLLASMSRVSLEEFVEKLDVVFFHKFLFSMKQLWDEQFYCYAPEERYELLLELMTKKGDGFESHSKSQGV